LTLLFSTRRSSSTIFRRRAIEKDSSQSSVPSGHRLWFLAELWRAAATPSDRKFLMALARNHPVLTPTQNNWLESGKILCSIRADHGFAPAKLRDLHFDVLIALTARSHGARLVTTDRTDFELINRYREIKLEVW
jgi:predicted nucleic acid-binding protein